MITSDLADLMIHRLDKATIDVMLKVGPLEMMTNPDAAAKKLQEMQRESIVELLERHRPLIEAPVKSELTDPRKIAIRLMAAFLMTQVEIVTSRSDAERKAATAKLEDRLTDEMKRFQQAVRVDAISEAADTMAAANANLDSVVNKKE